MCLSRRDVSRSVIKRCGVYMQGPRTAMSLTPLHHTWGASVHKKPPSKPVVSRLCWVFVSRDSGTVAQRRPETALSQSAAAWSRARGRGTGHSWTKQCDPCLGSLHRGSRIRPRRRVHETRPAGRQPVCSQEGRPGVLQVPGLDNQVAACSPALSRCAAGAVGFLLTRWRWDTGGSGRCLPLGSRTPSRFNTEKRGRGL